MAGGCEVLRGFCQDQEFWDGRVLTALVFV